jgi:hypothetical protein
MTRCKPNTRRRADRNRRAERRLLCSDLVKARWVTAAGERREEVAILEDLSPSGASLFLGVPAPAGVPLTLATPEREFKGKVRHCTPTNNGYLIGVEFPEAGGWRGEDAAAYTPEHLLDVARLDFKPEPEE